MSTNDFEIHITGPDAEAAAEALSQFFKDEFDHELEAKPTAADDVTMRSKGDPVAILALIMSVPSAMLAAQQLADRHQITTKINGLIEWAADFGKKKDAALVIKHPDGRVERLDAAQCHELLDAARKTQS